MFSGKIPCCRSLTTGSPSCHSNVNCKLQMRPQGCGHMTFCGLQVAVFHEKPDAKGLYSSHISFQLFYQPTEMTNRSSGT